MIRRSCRPSPRPSPHRRAAIAVEAAVVYPVLFLLLFGLIVGGIGVFRYQQVTCLAGEAARWVCVRGANWEKETGNPAITAAMGRRDVVLPIGVGLEESAVTVEIHWVNGITGEAVPWDASRRLPLSRNDRDDEVSNRVRVTVTYRWSPGVFHSSGLTLKSVCEIPMAY